jgi:hypothetical protein
LNVVCSLHTKYILNTDKRNLSIFLVFFPHRNPIANGTISTGLRLSALRVTALLDGGDEFAKFRYQVSLHFLSSKSHQTAINAFKKQQALETQQGKIVRTLLRCADATVEMAAAGSHYETLITLLNASDTDVGQIGHGL